MGQEEKFQFETHWYRCQPQHYFICQKQFQRFYRNRLRNTECVFRWVSKNEIWHHRSNIIYPPFQPSGTCPTLTFTYLPKSYRNCHQWSSQALVRLPFYSIAYKMVLKISHGTIWCPCFCTEVFSPIRYCCNPRRRSKTTPWNGIGPSGGSWSYLQVWHNFSYFWIVHKRSNSWNTSISS